MGMWRLYPSETLLQILHLSKMQTEKGQKFALIQINKLICFLFFLSFFELRGRLISLGVQACWSPGSHSNIGILAEFKWTIYFLTMHCPSHRTVHRTSDCLTKQIFRTRMYSRQLIIFLHMMRSNTSADKAIMCLSLR